MKLLTVYSQVLCFNRVLLETEEREENQEIPATKFVALHDFQINDSFFPRLIYCHCFSGSDRRGWRKRPTWRSRTTCKCQNLMSSMDRRVNKNAWTIRHLDICLVFYRESLDLVVRKDPKARKEIK